MNKYFNEEGSSIPVYDECDVLVVGGGAAGHSAAIAAARAGCKNVILMERYGYFGGDVTGGYVVMMPNLSWYNKSFVRGLQEEWFTRLEKNAPDSYMAPTLEEAGSSKPIIVDKWKKVFSCTKGKPGEQVVMRSPNFDPQQLKLELDAMVEECPNVTMLLDCWGTKPIVEDSTIKGVIFESKAGRKAVYAKICACFHEAFDAVGKYNIGIGHKYHGYGYIFS